MMESGLGNERNVNPTSFSGGVVPEVQDPTDGIGTVVFTEEEYSGFFGPTSNIAFTRQVVRTTSSVLKRITATGTPVSPNDTALKSHIVHLSRAQSPRQTIPTANSIASVEGEPFILPPEATMLQLIELFFKTTGTLFPFIDRNRFWETYRQLVTTNVLSVRRSWLGLLNMIFAITTNVNNMFDLTITAQARAAQSDIFFQRAMALNDRQIRLGTSLEVVQMLLLASMYSQGTERSIETWNIHGLAVKAAYQLGLHSPDALRQYPPVEREIRKRVWLGCVLLDRTLSMTLGRPVSIPESFVRVGLPQVVEDTQASTMSTGNSKEDPTSVQFFTATIILYRLMSEVFDALYGSNVGLEAASDVFEIAPHLLRFEQKFAHWQHSLPAAMPLISEADLSRPPDNFEITTLRVILTSRFLNFRILTHRPLLCKYLEAIGSSQVNMQQLSILRHVGANSVRICAQSAVFIIKITQWALQHADAPRQLLGAWWFSLYYAFNAALVIYSILLIQHQAKHHKQPIPMEDLELSTASLHKAVECLSWLYKGNRMTETCVRYTSALAKQLTLILQRDDTLTTDTTSMPPLADIANPMRSNSSTNEPHTNFGFFNSAELHMGLELYDFWQHPNAEFPADFRGSTLPNRASFEQ